MLLGVDAESRLLRGVLLPRERELGVGAQPLGRGVGCCWYWRIIIIPPPPPPPNRLEEDTDDDDRLRDDNIFVCLALPRFQSKASSLFTACC